jgi:hypothetical protein
MSIRVAWLGDDRYEAVVTPSAHSTVSWSSDVPMSGRDLLRHLVGLGKHQQDIVDACAEADPEFVEKMNRGDFG